VENRWICSGEMVMMYLVGALITLIAIWVGYHENRLRNEHGNYGACKHLKLGEEDAKFDKDLAETMPGLEKTLARFMDERAAGKLDDPDPKGKYKRVQHPVSWGCVEATVEIHAQKNASNAHGLFAKPGKYSAVVRLSKNAFDPDSAPKTSSVALKIFGVNWGPRASVDQRDAALREANKDTQDYIMISNQAVPLAVIPQELITVHEYLIWGKIPGAILWMLLKRPTLLPRVAQLLYNGWIVNNPFLAPHYTAQPSKLGEGQAARIGLFPCEPKPTQPSTPKTELNYIHHIVQDYVNNNEVCMKLMIQKQIDPCLDRVDDVLGAWTGPWEHVGDLRIKKGSQFDHGDVCENLSFNPFHALEANRPLGWVAKIRRDVYAMGSARRLEKNRALGGGGK
jgi:hypothetical protein